jgi:hypothetical protein
MRRFTSYGPVNPKLHYYAPREDLVNLAYTYLTGETPGEGGYYLTVWAPRQCGKTWLMLQVLEKIEKAGNFDVVKVDVEHLQDDTDADVIAAAIADDIFIELGKKNPGINTLKKFQELFTRDVLDKPLILIIDEFDALAEAAINKLTRVFRNIYNRVQKELRKPAAQRRYLLHGLALVGVRSVLGIENVKGSPFNIQRSLNVSNLAYEEVEDLFKWYEKESGQAVHPEVVQRLYEETNGQPGLTCWLGELLSEGFKGYANDTAQPIGMKEFETVYAAANDILPNNNILNIISKTREEKNRDMVLKLFQTDEKLRFRFDDPIINALYMHGVVDMEKGELNLYYTRFACPFVQKRLFNYFSGEMFKEMGQLVEPFLKLDRVITPGGLEVRELMKLYQAYLDKNSSWLFKDAPRRADLRVYEAVYHFNLYAYLDEFLRGKNGRVFPEFPTGNGKIDLLIRYKDNRYGLELKSFTDQAGFRDALVQASIYGKQLGLDEVYPGIFVETIDDKNKQAYETDYHDPETGVTVKPVFIQTGGPLEA